jgi:alpha-tubulin suppressor-like RCC1 family protein
MGRTRWIVAALAGFAAAAGCGRLGFTDRDVGDAGDDTGGSGADAAVGFTAIDVGGEFSCALWRGRAYCWGRNQAGELGTGDTTPHATPFEVALPAGEVVQLTAGNTHACAVLGDGRAFCWGTAILGNGSSSSTTPVPISSLPSPVTEISAGYDFTCAVAAGNGYCWGDDSGERLGNGTPGSSQTPVQILTSVTHVFAGGDHACAIHVDGTGACWGHNDGPGALGIGADTPTNASTPLPIADLTAMTAVTIAGYHACGIDAGAAYCWGTGGDGELGNGMTASSNRPVRTIDLASGVTAIHTGGGPSTADTVCAIQAGKLWCWGSGLDGRAGNRVADDVYAPAQVAGLSGVSAVAVGWYHTCAVAGGEVECWGAGDRGQLGDGNSATSFEPVHVVMP